MKLLKSVLNALSNPLNKLNINKFQNKIGMIMKMQNMFKLEINFLNLLKLVIILFVWINNNHNPKYISKTSIQGVRASRKPKLTVLSKNSSVC